MPWQLTRDVEEYAEHVWVSLVARPVENTVALTVVECVRAQRCLDEPVLFGWCDDGGATGAVSLVPSHRLLLAAVPPGTVYELVDVLRERVAQVFEVSGATSIVDRFAARWTAATRLRAVTAIRQLLYVLGAAPHPYARRPRAASGFG